MKSIVSLLLVLLFASCGKQVSESEKADDGVFRFSHQGELKNTDFPQLKDLSKLNDSTTDNNFSIYFDTSIIFTVSEDDNCTYFIYEEDISYYVLDLTEAIFEMNQKPREIFSKRPIITGLVMSDKLGNKLFEFEPKSVDFSPTPLVSRFENGTKTIYKGTVPKYYNQRQNLTESKLKRSKGYSLRYSYMVSSVYSK